MLPEDIDDVFRQQLGGHPTPPPPDLWARLQQHTAGEAVDQLFQAGLGGHASQPSRAVWERLEDEHLHPQPRRRRGVAVWWQLSAAAVVLLMMLAGGSLLWRGRHLGAASPGVATTGRARQATNNAAAPAATASQAATVAPEAAKNQALAGTGQPAAATGLAAALPAAKKNQESFSTQATAPGLPTSSTPIATTTRPRRPATAPQAAGSFQQKTQRPDAATDQLAHTGGRKTPASQPLTTPAVAPATPAATTPTLAVATALSTEIIEVEVRRGGGPATVAPAAAVATADAAPAPRRRLRLGGLLRQADHLVHGEPASLADATGPAETVTVQARLGGRVLSRTIDL